MNKKLIRHFIIAFAISIISVTLFIMLKFERNAKDGINIMNQKNDKEFRIPKT